MDENALIGTVLGDNYTLQKVIGQGEMGVVFLAHQIRPDRQVAMKVLLPLFPLLSEQYTAFLKRFQTEIDAIASLKHPHIVQIYEHGEYQDLIYLVMPYIDGGTLRDEMQREGPFPLPKALSYLEQMAAALDFAHAHGVIHGNVQPANILVRNDGQLVLTDFGLVKILYEMNISDSFHIRARMPIETFDYMAPEQVIGNRISTHVDLYSLGVVLYQMLTGTIPFQSSMVGQHMHTQPPAPRLLRPDLSIVAEQVVLKALATHPTKRYIRAADFADAFRQALVTKDDEQKLSASPALRSPDVHRTDVIKKTSFTIPSMSGFWGPGASQAPVVPEPPPLVPSQEEHISPPPMPISGPSWRWPTIEEADTSFASQPTVADSVNQPLAASDVQSPVRLIPLKTSARRRRVFAFALIACLLILMLSDVFMYANSRAELSGVKPVAVHNRGAYTTTVHTTPVNTAINSGGNTPVNSVGPGTRSFQVGMHPLLVIKGQGSNVSIHTGNTNTVVVMAMAHGNGNRAEIYYDQANDGQGHDRISIMTHPGYMNIDYDITVPGATLVQVQVNGGSVAVDGVSGVTIDTGGGNLDIENVRGPVNVHTENGDITAHGLTGTMDMEVGNGGSIRASNVNGSMKAVSHNGDVVVNEAVLNGASMLETNYGSVHFAGVIDPQGSYIMRTINGNINLTLPGDAAFQLTGVVGSGTIYNAFGTTIVGYGPRAQIMATIINGSVTVNKAP
ncbi:MAG: protein kinase [Ktedonobacteraceae bacterium]|nr:protein kinase [Ktedonobacteraceae bacterium]